MRNTPFLATAVTIGIAASWLTACAEKPESSGPTILAGIHSTANAKQSGSAAAHPRAHDAEGPTSLPYRGPDHGGIAYWLTLEVNGERVSHDPSASEPQPIVREMQKLDAAFRELPVESAKSSNDVFLVGLDALRFTKNQNPPKNDRETEIVDDRLRIRVNNETSVDNRANRVIGPYAPRLLLGRIFGVITHDPSGNPTKLSSRGAPAARQLMGDIPLLAAIAYGMVPLPEEPIAAGSRWSGVRIPPSYVGTLGLSVTINYSLASFDDFEGASCALILIDASLNEDAVTSVTGHVFDHVQVGLTGTAWVELETSRVRRVALDDQIRASWSNTLDSRAASENRIENTSKLVLWLRDPSEKIVRWPDGKPRFDKQ
jgi:hypothetical protein